MGAVERTAVPEASVDEDGDACPSEHDVSASAQIRQWSQVNPVAEPKRVQVPPERQLRSCIAYTLLAHTVPDRRVQGSWRAGRVFLGHAMSVLQEVAATTSSCG